MYVIKHTFERYKLKLNKLTLKLNYKNMSVNMIERKIYWMFFKKGLFVASIALLVLTLSNCSMNKSLNKNLVNEITFGSGGGFTGAVIKYQIKSSGEVTRFNTIENKTLLIKQIDNRELRNINKKINKLTETQLKFNQPENLYYFIELDNGVKTIITWGENNKEVPLEITQLYTYLNKLIKQK